MPSSQRHVGRRRNRTTSSSPANAGPEPSATIVASATPARSVPVKNVGWYAATPSPPSTSHPAFTCHPPRDGHRERAAKTTSVAAPTTMRSHPTPRGVASSGPRACAVPVVPNSSAASRTATLPGTAGDASEVGCGGAAPAEAQNSQGSLRSMNSTPAIIDVNCSISAASSGGGSLDSLARASSSLVK